jgi:hypothetical protein
MRTELCSSAGIYSPTFLNMRIATDESIQDIFSLSDQTAAALIHEYLHFLQDVTTVYGLRNIIMVVDFIKTVNMDQRGSASRSMKIPYQIDESKIRGATYNGPIQRLLAGTVIKISKGPIQRITKRFEKRELPPEIIDIEIIEIWVQKWDANKYDLGSHAILESMAYLVEQSMYPGVLPESDDFCYHAATLVGEFIYPEFAHDPLNLISLCDASLMYSNPGVIFYAMLNAMKDVSFHPTCYAEIYEFVLVRVQQSYGQLTHWDAILNNHTSTAIFQLNDYFTIDAFKINKEWIDFTLKNANRLRNAHVSLLTDLAIQGPIQTNNIFKTIYSMLGLPMVTNSRGQAWFATNAPNHANVRPEVLWVINQIYNIYINSANSVFKRCGLEQWCSETCNRREIEDYTDQRCYDNPWDRYKDRKELCAFSQVWRAWGMESDFNYTF